MNLFLPVLVGNLNAVRGFRDTYPIQIPNHTIISLCDRNCAIARTDHKDGKWRDATVVMFKSTRLWKSEAWALTDVVECPLPVAAAALPAQEKPKPDSSLHDPCLAVVRCETEEDEETVADHYTRMLLLEFLTVQIIGD